MHHSISCKRIKNYACHHVTSMMSRIESEYKLEGILLLKFHMNLDRTPSSASKCAKLPIFKYQNKKGENNFDDGCVKEDLNQRG